MHTVLGIFRDNPSRDVWLYYQILMMVKISKTEISAKIKKRKEIKVFILLPELHQKISAHVQGKIVPSNQT